MACDHTYDEKESEIEDGACPLCSSAAYREEHAIVDRVWKALGITDYAGAKGKAIDELVAEAVEKASRYDQLSE
jgi:hypothetical protein